MNDDPLFSLTCCGGTAELACVKCGEMTIVHPAPRDPSKFECGCER